MRLLGNEKLLQNPLTVLKKDFLHDTVPTDYERKSAPTKDPPQKAIRAYGENEHSKILRIGDT